jgi:hypothetical protein
MMPKLFFNLFLLLISLQFSIAMNAKNGDAIIDFSEKPIKIENSIVTTPHQSKILFFFLISQTNFRKYILSFLHSEDILNFFKALPKIEKHTFHFQQFLHEKTCWNSSRQIVSKEGKFSLFDFYDENYPLRNLNSIVCFENLKAPIECVDTTSKLPSDLDLVKFSTGPVVEIKKEHYLHNLEASTNSSGVLIFLIWMEITFLEKL